MKKNISPPTVMTPGASVNVKAAQPQAGKDGDVSGARLGRERVLQVACRTRSISLSTAAEFQQWMGQPAGGDWWNKKIPEP